MTLLIFQMNKIKQIWKEICSNNKYILNLKSKMNKFRIIKGKQNRKAVQRQLSFLLHVYQQYLRDQLLFWLQKILCQHSKPGKLLVYLLEEQQLEVLLDMVELVLLFKKKLTITEPKTRRYTKYVKLMILEKGTNSNNFNL